MDELRCQYCSRDFIKRDHLFRHERVHTKEKPFSCSACHASFARKDVLKRHQRRHSRSVANSARTTSVNGSASDFPLNHQLREKSASCHISEAVTQLGLPSDRLTSPAQLPQDCLGDEPWDSSLMTDLPGFLDGTLDRLSDASLPSTWTPTDHRAGFDVDLETWAIPSGDSATISSSSLGLWSEIQPNGSDQTRLPETASMTDEISCYQSKMDRRIHLVEAMHRACATNWCMSDFEMSVDELTPADGGTLGTEKSTPLRVHANLTTPMIFDHNLSRNPRFMKMCFNLYVEIFWPRFPIVHLPSLAPSWENNHLLFFSMCAIGSAFAGSRDALEFGRRLHDRVGFLIMSKWKSIMSSNSATNQLILILMQMHLDLHALLLGDSESLALSVTYLGPVVLWARRVGILQDFSRGQPSEGLHHTALGNVPASELHSRWRNWVDQEMKLRVAYTLAIIDSELGSIFSQPPLVKFRPERVRPLASDALFAAQTADEWRDIAQTEASQYADRATGHSSTVRIVVAHAEGYRNPLIQAQPPEMKKSHWLERILSITSLATRISVRRSELVDETDIFQDQDAFLQRLVECLPPLLADEAASSEDNICATIRTNNPGNVIPEENLEANILWHSTLISLLVDRDAIERYHGSEGIQRAQSTLISLPPSVVVELVLHCLLVRCLVQKLSHGRHHLPIFVSRCALHAGMVLNWYQDQKRDLGVHRNTTGVKGGPDELGVNVPFYGPSPFRIEDWNNELNPADPFVILIQKQSTREKLQAMLDVEDVIFSMTTALQQSNSLYGKDSSFTRCLEILANYEMGLDALGDTASK